MPANPTVPDPHVQRLVDEGYQVSLEGDYLIVDQVPYIASVGVVGRGALITAYRNVDGIPYVDDHTVWFTGSVPLTSEGASLANAMVADTERQRIAGREVQCRFSNKPEPIGDMLANHYNKLIHYVRKLTGHARAIDPSASAASTGSFSFRQKHSVFFYPNSAIALAGMDEYEAKLRLNRVCIIGAGGTGSYILDALAKEEIIQIDVYDHDVAEPKNTFRMPGALSTEQAHAKPRKAELLAGRYSVMRTGVNGHALRIDSTNTRLLENADFVFLAIDHGPSRGVIARFLVTHGIPFIDVGIGVEKIAESTKLIARARVTLITPHTATLVDELPVSDDAEDAVYNNIQVVELNALNAMLAVIRFKQFLGFYADEKEPAVVKYVSSWSQLCLRDPALQ